MSEHNLIIKPNKAELQYWRNLWNLYFPIGSLRARIAGGAFWMLAGSAAAQVLTAVCGIVVARILGAEDYGVLAIVTSTIAMFNVIAELSLGLTTNKHVAEFRKSDPARAGRIIALGTMLTVCTGIVGAISVAMFATLLATRVLQSPEIAQYLRLGAPLLFFSAINGVQMGTLAGFESFKTISIGRVIMALLALPLLVTGVLMRGISGVLIAQIMLSCAGFVWFHLAIKRQSRAAGVVVLHRHAWRERGLLLSFALPSLLAALMTMPVIWAANAILVRSPNGLTEMGMFNAAGQWRSLIAWTPAAIGQVALPILTSLISQGERLRFTRALKINIGANLLVGLAVAIPISLCSYWIMSLYGPEFSQRWLALVMLSGAAVLQATLNVIGQVLASTSRMWWGFFLNLLWAGELLVLTWYLVRFGADGLATAHFLAYLLHLIQVAAYTSWVLRYDTRLAGSRDWPRDRPQAAQLID